MPDGGAAVGSTVALYPGAFRPPHVNHFDTVRQLAERPDVDEVVVIVTNRARTVPGTTKVLDVDAAVAVWSLYGRHLDKLRVEVAATSAVGHALDYIGRATMGDRLLLVVGAKEAQAGRTRFGKLHSRPIPRGVTVAIVAGATTATSLGATDLRRLLASGETGRTEFMATLPAELDERERLRVWEVCRAALIERREVSIARIREVLDEAGLGPIGSITPAKARDVDEVYVATLASDRRAFVRYGNDAVATDGLLDGDERKPRHRLKAERAAIKWLRRNIGAVVEIPEVLCFDKATRTLALSEVCAGGRPLANDLIAGRFDRNVAVKLGRFLGAVHAEPTRSLALWDDPSGDLVQWQRVLTAGTARLPLAAGHRSISAQLAALSKASAAASGVGFRHLDLTGHNVLIAGRTVGVIDFERSAGFGDPAYDLGTILGHYLLGGLRSGQVTDCEEAFRQSIVAYRAIVGARWDDMSSRVVGFAGASLLRLGGASPQRPWSSIRRQVLQAAADLLRASTAVDPAPVTTSLAAALARATPGVGAASDSHRKGAPRAVRRRWLRPLDQCGSWVATVATIGQDELVLDIAGGDPLATIDVRIDGKPLVSASLDAVGSAELTLSWAPAATRIEVHTASGTVLGGRIPGAVNPHSRA